MIRRITSVFCALGLFLLAVGTPAAKGQDRIDFNTTSGVMKINDIESSTFFGVPMQVSEVDGKAQFRFLGDLSFVSSDLITASGSRPLSLWAGNNVFVQSGAHFFLDAAGQTGKLGGGDGGANAAAGIGGSGGAASNAVAGGQGGASDFGDQDPGIATPGAPGENGGEGTRGTFGSAGRQGGAGFNNATGVQAAGAGGNNGPVVFNFDRTVPVAGGAAGAGGDIERDGGDGQNGGPGVAGGQGPGGGNGGDGFGGRNNITGLLLSGGAGGSAGGSGGGGFGGEAGTSGGGGGGGGEGDEGFFQSGGDGGSGGGGGAGGRGGGGSAGALGVGGGAGGAAVEIVAQGRLLFAGRISVRGADVSSQRNYAANPQSGGQSSPGGAGEEGNAGGSTAGDGGNGGAGGAGGRGGDGGFGGNGGYGGAGAGGTVLIKSTLFSAEGGTITASGGISYIGNDPYAGGDGRYVTAHNGYSSPDFGAVVSAHHEDFADHGSRGVNPYFFQGAQATPNVVSLVGGADVFGIKARMYSDPYFNDVRAGAPANATAALVRRSVGPSTGEQYGGYDLLMLVNLTDGPLANPMLGVGVPFSGFQTPLMEQGLFHNPMFGGGGPVVLSELPAGSVFATLIPIPTGFAFYEVNASAGGGLTTVPFNTLNIAYIVPDVLAGDFDLDGDVDGGDFLEWQRGESPNNGSAAELAVWRDHFGESASTAIAATVPEPATLTLLMFAAAGIRLRRRHSA